MTKTSTKTKVTIAALATAAALNSGCIVYQVPPGPVAVAPRTESMVVPASPVVVAPYPYLYPGVVVPFSFDLFLRGGPGWRGGYGGWRR